MKWLLLIPPTGNYIRDTRCQTPIVDVFAVVNRAPADFLYIAGGLTKRGDNVIIMDCSVSGISLDDLENYLMHHHIDYLLINTTLYTYKEDLQICELAKRYNPKITTIAKGAAFIYKPEAILEMFIQLDIAVLREEENTIISIANKGCYEEVPNIVYRDNGKIKKNNIKIDKKFRLPMPNIKQIDPQKYIRPDTGEAQATVVVARGCAGRCNYCIAPIIGGNQARYRCVDDVIDEIKLYVEESDIYNFYFSSDSFTEDSEWVIEFCNKLSKFKYKINWLCTSRADLVNDSLLKTMKNAGCWGMAIGIESANEDIQKDIRKELSRDQILQCVKACNKYRIVTLCHFMIGFPHETKNSIKQTIKFSKKIGCTIPEYYIVTPLPGTSLYNKVVKEGYFDPKNNKDIRYTMPNIDTEYLTQKELLDLRFNAIISNYFNPLFYINAMKYITSFKQFKNMFIYTFIKITKILKNIYKQRKKRNIIEKQCRSSNE